MGIDKVLRRAGVAKGSLYYNFGSKDELVGAYLSTRHDAWVSLVEEAVAAAATPRFKILAIFEALTQLHAQPGYNGCAFTSASQGPLGPRGTEAVDDFRDWLTELLFQLSTNVGAADADGLARALLLLHDGANAAARLDNRGHVGPIARHIAEVLVDGYCSAPAPTA